MLLEADPVPLLVGEDAELDPAVCKAPFGSVVGKATGDSFEREYKVGDGRFIVGIGLRMSSHDIAGLKVVSQRWELSR
ncbi:MAG: hypothetical protein IPJ88_04985 [Myxococcales bacterium]|nr:MAG: hypothetical protein IPJ88_04985 [Myxococcales bacterium]